MNENSNYPPESPTITPPQNGSWQNEELRSVVEETLFRMHADHSQPQPTDSYLQAMVVSWATHLSKAGILWHEVPQLYDNAIQSRASDDKRRGYMPVVEDLLHEWDVLSQQTHQVAVADKWREHDAELLKALPRGMAGQGRQAYLAHLALGRAVACKCPPKNGLDWPAQLNKDASAWVCQQRNNCGFHLPVSETQAAPPARYAGPLSPTPGHQDEIRKAISTIADVPKATPNHSAFLMAFAADARVDLDKCDPQQYVDFRRFAQWYRDTYPGCKVTPALLAEEYPNFLKAAAPKPKYI